MMANNTLKAPHRLPVLFAAALLACAAPGGVGLFAQRKPPIGGFFLSLAGQYYAFPGAPFASPATLPGARVGLGGEAQVGQGAVALGVEAGWTRLALAGNGEAGGRMDFIPVAARLGYGRVMGAREGAVFRLDGLAGAAVEMTRETHVSPLFGGRLDVEFRLTKPLTATAAHLFIGGGVDIVPESGGVVWLPVVEAGLKVRPNAGGKMRRDMLRSAGSAPRRVILEDGTEGLMLAAFTVSYPDNGDTPDAKGGMALLAAGQMLRKYPKARITVIGHAGILEGAAVRNAVKARERAIASAGAAAGGRDVPRMDAEAVLIDAETESRALALRRANNTAAALAASSVPARRISVTAATPEPTARTAEAAARSRRVEIILTTPQF